MTAPADRSRRVTGCAARPCRALATTDHGETARRDAGLPDSGPHRPGRHDARQHDAVLPDPGRHDSVPDDSVPDDSGLDDSGLDDSGSRVSGSRVSGSRVSGSRVSGSGGSAFTDTELVDAEFAAIVARTGDPDDGAIAVPSAERYDRAGGSTALRDQTGRIASALFCTAGLDAELLDFAIRRVAEHHAVDDAQIADRIADGVLQIAVSLAPVR